jgi:hypothetical protein
MRVFFSGDIRVWTQDFHQLRLWVLKAVVAQYFPVWNALLVLAEDEKCVDIKNWLMLSFVEYL